MIDRRGPAARWGRHFPRTEPLGPAPAGRTARIFDVRTETEICHPSGCIHGVEVPLCGHSAMGIEALGHKQAAFEINVVEVRGSGAPDPIRLPQQYR